ncbi:glycerol dehydratase reactivase beta/small subunit family protein [Sporomusa sp. GT1]|uniref:glycerol dehydratase reactivase beta/small subunit family protein n=1 Tax=Sporomusa sp. GT1 TaxID=1534747 RepID=UPI00166857A0|nr:glycerol dehydratase reactivase beta/small subunit family protein [Sporomusa sp. GT1]
MQIDKAANKPSIIICTYPHTGYEAKLRELQAGMEEEGVPCLLADAVAADAVALAYKGAQVSPLGVGIGISPDSLCVHYQKLPERQPLFVLAGAGSQAEWRTFGYNAARLVKGLPFKTTAAEVEPAAAAAAPAASGLRAVSREQGTSRQAAANDDMAELYATVRKIVLKVLQENVQGHGEVNTWSKTP